MQPFKPVFVNGQLKYAEESLVSKFHNPSISSGMKSICFGFLLMGAVFLPSIMNSPASVPFIGIVGAMSLVVNPIVKTSCSEILSRSPHF